MNHALISSAVNAQIEPGFMNIKTLKKKRDLFAAAQRAKVRLRFLSRS